MDMIVNAKPRDRVATIHEEETKTKQILTAAKEKLPTILEDGPSSFVLSKGRMTLLTNAYFTSFENVELYFFDFLFLL